MPSTNQRSPEIIAPTTIENAQLLARRAVFSPMELGEWQRLGRMFVDCHDGLKFWVGDWFNFGSKNYGKLAQQSLELVGVDVSMARECGFTASQIKPSRRSEKLSYGHHQAIAADAKPSQQLEFIKMAEDHKLTVPELRRRIRWANAECPPTEDLRLTDLVIEAEVARWARWRARQNFSEWSDEKKDAARADLEPLINIMVEVWETLRT